MSTDARARRDETAHYRHVLDAMQDLSAGDQQLLMLSARQHLDHDQLATLLGISATTVSLRLRHARVNLARALAAQEIRNHEHH